MGGTVSGREGRRHQGWGDFLVLGELRGVGLVPHPWGLGSKVPYPRPLFKQRFEPSSNIGA